MESEIVVVSDLNAVAREAAERWVRLSREAIAARGKFSVALSGGSAPPALFALLASQTYRTQIAWDRAVVLWGDERCVPPEHADSNYRMAHETLLSRVPVAPGNVHRMRGEANPEQAALEYEQTVRREVPPRDGLPSIDLNLLGLGPDGHTASLFPGTPPIHERTRLVVANFVPKLNAHRITFTPPLINASAHVMILVAGPEKADALRAVLEGEFKPDVFPAQIVKPAEGTLTWLVDQAAAAHLSHR